MANYNNFKQNAIEDTPDNKHDTSSDEERIEKLSMMTVAAAKGIVPVAQVMIPLVQIVNSQLAPLEIQAFVKVLLKILKGNKNPDIGAHLPSYLAKAVQQTLEQIETPLPNNTDNAEREGLSLAELLERVKEACSGNLLLWQQLWNFTEELENAPKTPAEIKKLATVLKKILAGERQKHVTENLSPDLAQAVDLLLTQLTTG